MVAVTRKTCRRIITLCLVFILLSMSFVSAEEQDLAAAEQNLIDHGLTLENVLDEYYGEKEHTKAWGSFQLRYLPDGTPAFTLYDVTGDGCVDLITGRMFGSGMVRLELIVFDPLAHETYILDGYNYDYFVSSVSEDRLVVVERGPNGSGEPVTEIPGTIKLEDNRLVFVPDDPSQARPSRF